FRPPTDSAGACGMLIPCHLMRSKNVMRSALKTQPLYSAAGPGDTIALRSRESSMKRTVIAIAALVASAGVGYGAAVVGPVPDASSLNAKAFKMTLPNDIKWGPAAGLPGTDAYVL